MGEPRNPDYGRRLARMGAEQRGQGGEKLSSRMRAVLWSELF